MKTTHLLSLALACLALIPSCKSTGAKAIDSAYKYRNIMMTEIGKAEGCETCWNTLEDLKVGGIYRLNGQQLSYSNFSWFENSLGQISQEKDISEKSPNKRYWNHNVTKSRDVGVTLSYIGLGAEAKTKGTKKIVFTATGDKYKSIKNENQLESMLNLAQEDGPALRAAILDDTAKVRQSQEEAKSARLAGKKARDIPAVKLPKYWIAARAITAKDFNLKLLTTHDNLIKLNVADGDKLADTIAKHLQVSGITISGSAQATDIGDTDTSIGGDNVAATIYPLTAVQQPNGDIKITIETDGQLLQAANLKALQ